MGHIKLVSYAVDSSKDDCKCVRFTYFSRMVHSCSSVHPPDMVPVAYFQAVKSNKTMVKDGTKVTITNIRYQYKGNRNAPSYWPGKRDLKDLGDHQNERGNKFLFLLKTIFTEIL